MVVALTKVVTVDVVRFGYGVVENIKTCTDGYIIFDVIKHLYENCIWEW